MNRSRFFAPVLFVCLAACTRWTAPLGQKVVLDVNGKQLTGQQFAQELAFRLKDHDSLSAKDPNYLKLTKKQIAEDFLVQTLTEDWAKDNGLVLKAEELDQEITRIQKSYPDDLSFQQALAERGTSFSEWREKLRKSLLQKVVLLKLAGRTKEPTELELQSYYQEHKAQFSSPESVQIRQILVNSEQDAKMIEEELKKGRRLSDLAIKYSISPEGPQGGMVGWIEKGSSDVFEAGFSMKVGRRSPIIKSAFGHHIFELVARRPARVKTLVEAKGEVRRILMEKDQHSIYLSWLEEQTRKARVFKDQVFIDGLNVETRLK